MLSKTVSKLKKMELKIGLIGANGRLGKEISQLSPIFPINKNTSRKNLNLDVLIDVSSAEALEENLSANLPIVVGTTGHKTLDPLTEAAKNIPILFASNFSIGALLLAQMASFLNKHFPSDIDIIEAHHKTKKDKPSGTALSLKKILPNATIHSIRSGTIIGNHSIHFNTNVEKILLSHEVYSREAFAKGALLAASFVKNQPPGLYTMDNLFS